MTTLTLSTRIADDADEHAALITGWSQRYIQLSAGAYLGRLHEVQLPQMQLFNEYAEQATYQHCVPPAGTLWFGLPDEKAGASLRFAGREVAPCSVLVAPGGEEFCLRTPERFLIGGVVMAPADAETAAAWRRGGPRIIPLPGPLYRALKALPARALALAGEAPEQLLGAGAFPREVSSALLGVLAAGGTPIDRRAVQDRQLRWVEQTERWAHCAGDAPASVDALCQRLHVTRRTLQNGFQAVTATAPLGFMRAQQMAAVRRALCDRAQAARPIRDIAAAFGFENPSQFSQDYRAHFGEAPSRTRERTGGAHSPAAAACC